MAKKSVIFGTGVVLVAGVAAGAYLLLRPQPTPPVVTEPVDIQYEQLEVQLNDLNAQVQQDGSNVDSLALVLHATVWTPVEGGGEYEQKKRNLFLDTKKDVALTFRKVMIGRGMSITDPMFEEIESISE